MSDRPIKLRRLTMETCLAGTETHDLPVEFEGTREECNAYAAEHGFRWQDNRNVFGGYFTTCGTDRPNRECLMPTY